jgi:hypothetical protein
VHARDRIGHVLMDDDRAHQALDASAIEPDEIASLFTELFAAGDGDHVRSRSALLLHARRAGARPTVIAALRRISSARTFSSVADVLAALADIDALD